MKILFMVLWGISLLFWLIYAIRTVIEIKRDGDYINYTIKMNISLCFMWIFNGLMIIF